MRRQTPDTAQAVKPWSFVPRQHVNWQPFHYSYNTLACYRPDVTRAAIVYVYHMQHRVQQWQAQQRQVRHG